MKQSGRLALRITAGFVTLAGLVAVLCLDGVDYRPYFKSAYYSKTVERLRAQTATNIVTFGKLEAGFGKAKLTPTVNGPFEDAAHGSFHSLPLAGYGNRQGKPATGVHDDLYVKAVALKVGDKTAVMVGADTLIIPREVSDMVETQLERELGLRRAQIYLSATHTHCSIGGWGEGIVAESFAGGFRPGARIWFADRLVAAIRSALADLQPTEFGRGSFVAQDLIRNRLVGNLGKTDPEFSFLVLRQETGMLGVIGSYSAHATVLSDRMMEFSADYPGCWQRAVEEATGGIAVFLAGGVGSQAPVPPGNGFEGAQRMGKHLAQQVLAALPTVTMTNWVAFDFRGLDVDMPPLGPRICDTIRLRPWLAARLLPVARQSFLQVVRLQDAIWISTPCDFSGELALRIKESSILGGFHATITSFNGDYVGYVIPSRYYHLDGYEPRLMSFYGPYVPDYFEDLIRKMAACLGVNP